MSDNEFQATEELSMSVERSSEDGSVILTITANHDTITINVGLEDDDALQLADELGKTTTAAQAIADSWEARPDAESDAFVCETRDGYTAQVEGVQVPCSWNRWNAFPSRDIATYELVRYMTEHGIFPRVWYQNERGNTDNIGQDVSKYFGPDDKAVTLPGVRYEEGETVTLPAEDWKTWVVDGDYGDLGVQVHTSGDPDVNMLAAHDQITPYEDEDE